MKVRYTKFPDKFGPGGYNWHPLLQVCLRYGTKRRVLHALVDSGAVECVFPEAIGKLLAIDVPSGVPKTYFGIAEQGVPGFVHTIELQVTGLNQWITIEAGFVRADFIPLLGQAGFFEKYQVIFERSRHQFEINSRENALMRGRRGR